MEGPSVFDRLSMHLSNDERRRMLASIRRSMESQAAPLADEPPGPPLPVEQQVKVLGIWRRFLLFLAQVFGGRDREDVIRQWLLRDLEQEVQQQGGEAMDGRRRLFLERFAADIEALAAGVDQVAPRLRVASSHRRELVMSLAMELFPVLHRDLLTKTEEEYISSLNENSERYLKRVLADVMEDSIEQIPPDARSAMRRAMTQADTLVALATVNYGGMLASFEVAGEGGARRCSFEYLSRSLTDIYQQLVNIQQPLDLTLLETLVLLSRSVDGDDTESDPEEFQARVREAMEEVLDVLDRFRTFGSRYPLLPVLQLIREDPWWGLSPVEAGEDWIALYRAFFSDRIHRQVLRVSLQGQLGTRLAELADVCGNTLKPLAGLPTGSAGVETAHWFLGVALKSLTAVLWKDVLPNLRIILTSGEFYKSSNRAQFNDAYDEFERLPDRVDLLEHDLRPDESWGAMLLPGTDATYRAKMARRVDQEIRSIYESARITLEVLVNVLGGILYARPGSSYDTLANYGQIGGRRNAEFIEELKEVHRRLSGYLAAAAEIDAVERRAVENGIRLRSPRASVAKSTPQIQ